MKADFTRWRTWAPRCPQRSGA